MMAAFSPPRQTRTSWAPHADAPSYTVVRLGKLQHDSSTLMAIGFICSCCGERGELSQEGSADLALICAPCTEAPAAAAPDMSVHTIPVETSVVCLAAAAAFEGLTPKERAYALAIGRASWEGAKICLLQCSAESAPIFALLQLVFSAQPVGELLAAAKVLA